jgi:hypothetical protein
VPRNTSAEQAAAARGFSMLSFLDDFLDGKVPPRRRGP